RRRTVDLTTAAGWHIGIPADQRTATMRQRMTTRLMAHAAGVALSLMLATGPALAAPACQTGGSFERWLEAFKQEAAAQGISRNAIVRALNGVTYDPNVIRRDRGQGVFTQSFLQFSDRMAGGGRYQIGLRKMKEHADLLQRIEAQFGVPPAVV